MPGWRTLGRGLVAAGLAGALVISSAAPALGSAQQNGQSGSSNSSNSNSSNGSNDSSNSSKDSSNNSNDSSKNSNNSTQNSPKNSTDDSSDWTTNSHGAHVFSLAFVVVAVGASVVGTVAAGASHRANRQQAVAALADFMRRQHALLTHDVATADGPVLDAWTHDLGLDARERLRLRRALDGSTEQGRLLDALDGRIDDGRAEVFAVAFLRITERALGRARAGALVARAARATGVG